MIQNSSSTESVVLSVFGAGFVHGTVWLLLRLHLSKHKSLTEVR